MLTLPADIQAAVTGSQAPTYDVLDSTKGRWKEDWPTNEDSFGVGEPMEDSMDCGRVPQMPVTPMSGLQLTLGMSAWLDMLGREAKESPP